MVKTITARAAVLLASALLAAGFLSSCDFFTTTPFPGFVDKTDKTLDLGSRVDVIAANKSPLTYDLTVITDPANILPPRLLFLVEPPSSDPTLGFTYTGQLLFLDQDLNVLGQAATKTSLDYFGKPYTFAPASTVLAGYTVLTTSGGDAGVTLSNHGLEGYAFTTGTETYIFASPSGQYASFDISFVGYTNAWGLLPNTPGTLPILPAAARPSASDPNYAHLGYQLAGLSFNSGSQEVTFVLSEPAEGRILAVRQPLASIIVASPAALLPGAASWPVPDTSWPVIVSADRPAISVDGNGFFLVTRDGWMQRYTWTPTGALSLAGSMLQIAGDRSLTRRYAFLVPQLTTDPTYMYRFDPSSRILTRYRRWW
jgi:hypothetical protein